MKNRKRVYLHPMTDTNNLDRKHPYVAGLVEALSPHFDICNKGKKSRLGPFGVIKYTFSFDVLYLNWIEDIGLAKLGKVQMLFMICFINLIKLLNKKVVWAHHNVCSHAGANRYNKYMSDFMARKADVIITHSQQSTLYIKECHHSKIRFYFHPITDFSRERFRDQAVEYDILIWGAIRRSKGVEDFLEYLKQNRLLDRFKIRIVGKINDARLKEQIFSYRKSNIHIEDRFIETDELQTLHCSAKFVLFSYSGESVLVSGAVVRSLPLGTPIIGPHRGAFVDLADLGLISTYKSFRDIVEIVSTKQEIDMQKLRCFCKEHTWQNFGHFLSRVL